MRGRDRNGKKLEREKKKEKKALRRIRQSMGKRRGT